MAPRDLDLDAIPDPLADESARAIDVPPPPTFTEASPTRAGTSRRRWVVVIASAIWIASLSVLWLGLRGDLLRAPVLAQIGGFAIALPIALSVALRPRASGFPAGVLAARVVAVAILAALVAISLWPMSGMEVPLTPRTATPCFVIALAMAAAPLAGSALTLRGAFVSAPALRGALVGAACGVAGTLGIHAHCPIVTSSHVLVSHAAPVLVLAAAGALVGVWRGRA